MAVHIWRNRRRDPAAEEPASSSDRPRRVWPMRAKSASAEPATGTTPQPKTVVVERRAPRSWRRRGRHNPVSGMILGAAWAAVIILGLGMLLTLADANPGNTLVNSTLDAGRWLATPFHDVFTNPNPDHQLYQNWGLAAAVYYLLGRGLSWLTRF